MKDLDLKRIKAMIVFLSSVLVLTLVDQLSKLWADAVLKGKRPLVVIDEVFEFHYIENTGTAWGLFGGGRQIFLIVAAVIFVFILYLIHNMPLTKKYLPVYLDAILVGAGALGNSIDRLFLGYVRDFIYFKLIDFPVFNFADICITIAQVILIIQILFIYNENDFSFLKKSKRNKIENE